MRNKSIFSLTLTVLVILWFLFYNYTLTNILNNNNNNNNNHINNADRIIFEEHLNSFIKNNNDAYDHIRNNIYALQAKLDEIEKESKKDYQQLKDNEIKQIQSLIQQLLSEKHLKEERETGDISKLLKKESEKLLVSVIAGVDYHSLSSSSIDVVNELNRMASQLKIKMEMLFMVKINEGDTIQLSPVVMENIVADYKPVITTSSSIELLLNEGAIISKGEYLLFLHPPQRVTSLDLKKLLGFMKNERVGVVGGMSVISDASSASSLLVANAGIDIAYGKDDVIVPYFRYQGAGVHYPQVNKEDLNATAVSKSGMLIRRELFMKVYGFSGEYSSDFSDNESDVPSMAEDLHLCFLVRNAGYTIKAVPVSSWFLQREEEACKAKLFDLWKSMMAAIIDERRVIKDMNLVWDLYCGCTGVNVEAINYLVTLESKLSVAAVANEACWCKGFPEFVRQSLLRIGGRKVGPKVDMGNVQIEDRPLYVIGSSMSETDSIGESWAKKCNESVDEVWIPTEFHRGVFSASGVPLTKLRVIPESLDTLLYHPQHTQPYNKIDNDVAAKGKFKFLSVFKWEERKGWDVLLKAYFEEFNGDKDKVALILHTYLYGEYEPRNKENVLNRIEQFSLSLGLKKSLPTVIVITDELDELKMPELYRGCDAFVLPTRGEGWGLPAMEAMAMGLPTIVTNWSGPTGFTTPDIAYLLNYDGLEEVPFTFQGSTSSAKWAKPSVTHLKQLMRQLYTYRERAMIVGGKARSYISEKFDRNVVGDILVKRLLEIRNELKMK